MGAVYADIELVNSVDLALVRRGVMASTDVRRRTVRMLADTGATVLVIPESLSAELGLDVVGRRAVLVADGTIRDVDLVGPIQVTYRGRSMTGDAVVMPGDSQLLLGQVQMEEMDLIVDPLAQELIANPASPDRARMMAVGARLLGG